MDRRERIDLLRKLGRSPFIVIGKWNQIRKCNSCGDRYFQHLKFIGDDRSGDTVTAEYCCWYCGKLHEDGWFWRKFKIHYGWLKRGAR